MHGTRAAAGLVALALLAAGVAQARQEVPQGETFVATAEVRGQNATSTAEVVIHVERYTRERDRTRMLEALRLGGYPGLLPVLREAPEAGYVELNGRKSTVRWARQVPSGSGRAISIVTDTPLFFVGGGAVDARPREGFELAVLQFEVDADGRGTGTMAAAARIRPGGETGVQIDDYAEEPVALTEIETTDRAKTD